MKVRKFFGGAFLASILSVGIFGQSVTGRTTSVAVDPSDPSGNTYYVGSANGGVWKTTDGGTSFVLIQLVAGAAYFLSTR